MSLGIRRIYAIAVIFLPYFTIRFYVIFIKVDRIILSRYATIQIPSTIIKYINVTQPCIVIVSRITSFSKQKS